MTLLQEPPLDTPRTEGFHPTCQSASVDLLLRRHKATMASPTHAISPSSPADGSARADSSGGEGAGLRGGGTSGSGGSRSDGDQRGKDGAGGVVGEGDGGESGDVRSGVGVSAIDGESSGGGDGDDDSGGGKKGDGEPRSVPSEHVQS
jgi:hypothetical protein